MFGQLLDRGAELRIEQKRLETELADVRQPLTDREEELDLGSPHFDDESYQVEMEPAPPLLNTILSGVTWTESQFLRWVSLPVGTSIICIAQKPQT